MLLLYRMVSSCDITILIKATKTAETAGYNVVSLSSSNFFGYSLITEATRRRSVRAERVNLTTVMATFVSFVILKFPSA